MKLRQDYQPSSLPWCETCEILCHFARCWSVPILSTEALLQLIMPFQWPLPSCPCPLPWPQ